MGYININSYFGIKLLLIFVIVFFLLGYVFRMPAPYHLDIFLNSSFAIIVCELSTWSMRHNGWVVDYELEKYRGNSLVEEPSLYFKIIFKMCRVITIGEYYYLKSLGGLWTINQGIAFLYLPSEFYMIEAILGLVVCILLEE